MFQNKIVTLPREKCKHRSTQSKAHCEQIPTAKIGQKQKSLPSSREDLTDPMRE